MLTLILLIMVANDPQEPAIALGQKLIQELTANPDPRGVNPGNMRGNPVSLGQKRAWMKLI